MVLELKKRINKHSNFVEWLFSDRLHGPAGRSSTRARSHWWPHLPQLAQCFPSPTPRSAPFIYLLWYPRKHYVDLPVVTAEVFFNGWIFLAEESSVKMAVESTHGSVKMRTSSQVPNISAEDDLTSVLLQVGIRVYNVPWDRSSRSCLDDMNRYSAKSSVHIVLCTVVSSESGPSMARNSATFSVFSPAASSGSGCAESTTRQESAGLHCHSSPAGPCRLARI